MREPNAGTATLVCVPGAIPTEERPAHQALFGQLFGEAAEDREAIPNGYAFRFSPELLDALARFVSNERKCCPFLEFTIQVTPDGGPMWLRVTGPAGTPEFLEAELRQ